MFLHQVLRWRHFLFLSFFFVATKHCDTCKAGYNCKLNSPLNKIPAVLVIGGITNFNHALYFDNRKLPKKNICERMLIEIFFIRAPVTNQPRKRCSGCKKNFLNKKTR